MASLRMARRFTRGVAARSAVTLLHTQSRWCGLRPGTAVALWTRKVMRAVWWLLLADAYGWSRSSTGSVAAIDRHAAEHFCMRLVLSNGVVVVVAPEPHVCQAA